MIDNYRFRLLLEKAGRLYERHEAGRPEPFNVFSVLRSQHDEVRTCHRINDLLHRAFVGLIV